MKQNETAGPGRRGRRLVLDAAAVLMIVGALLVVIGRGRASNDHDSLAAEQQRFSRPDDVMAAALLQAVNGANPVLCASVERVFRTGNWGGALLPPAEDSLSADAQETVRWIGKNRIDRAALSIARSNLASADACTRKIATRIIGDIDVERLDDLLDAELKSTDPLLRAGAVIALGYAEQSTSVARVQSFLQDSNRNVRLSAIWALGRIGDERVSDEMRRLLEKDQDPDARRLAAWALGKIHG